MHQRERHPRYIRFFADFLVGIPEFAENMRLICICFALLTHIVLFLCFCHFLVQFHLFEGCWA